MLSSCEGDRASKQPCRMTAIKRRKQPSFQEQRRKDFLNRQKDIRSSRADVLRHMLDTINGGASIDNTYQSDIDEDRVCDIDIDASSPRNKPKPKKDKEGKYRDQLMIPEYLVEIPHDFGGGMSSSDQSKWLVCRRPRGTRCLVISFMGWTTSRDCNGKVIERFRSLLPGGSPATTPGTAEWAACGRRNESSRKMLTILDCIYSAHCGTYYVLDVINWKDYPLQDCTAEFRMYWLSNKFTDDCDTAIKTKGPLNDHAFNQLVFSSVCGSTVEEQVYGSDTPFLNDGLIFYHKNGHYEMGLTPLVLLWQYFEMLIPIEPVLAISPQLGDGTLINTVLEYREWSQKVTKNQTDGAAEMGYGYEQCGELMYRGLFTLDGFLVHQLFTPAILLVLDGETVSNGDFLTCSFQYIRRDGFVDGSCLLDLKIINRFGKNSSSSKNSAVESWSKLLYLDSKKRCDYISIARVIEGASTIRASFDSDDEEMIHE